VEKFFSPRPSTLDSPTYQSQIPRCARNEGAWGSLSTDFASCFHPDCAKGRRNASFFVCGCSAGVSPALEFQAEGARGKSRNL